MGRRQASLGTTVPRTLTYAAAIEALLRAETDILDLNRAAEAQLDAELADAAAIEALLQAEPYVLDLDRALHSPVQSAGTLSVNK